MVASGSANSTALHSRRALRTATGSGLRTRTSRGPRAENKTARDTGIVPRALRAAATANSQRRREQSIKRHCPRSLHLLPSGLYRRRRNLTELCLAAHGLTRRLRRLGRHASAWLTAGRELGLSGPHPAPKVGYAVVVVIMAECRGARQATLVRWSLVKRARDDRHHLRTSKVRFFWDGGALAGGGWVRRRRW